MHPEVAKLPPPEVAKLPTPQKCELSTGFERGGKCHCLGSNFSFIFCFNNHSSA